MAEPAVVVEDMRQTPPSLASDARQLIGAEDAEGVALCRDHLSEDLAVAAQGEHVGRNRGIRSNRPILQLLDTVIETLHERAIVGGSGLGHAGPQNVGAGTVEIPRDDRMIPTPDEPEQIFAVEGDEKPVADEGVVLDGLESEGARSREGMTDDERVIVAFLNLGELAPVQDVLDLEGVEPELVTDLLHVGSGEFRDVEPQPAVSLAYLIEALDGYGNGLGRTGWHMEQVSHPRIIGSDTPKPRSFAAPT